MEFKFVKKKVIDAEQIEITFEDQQGEETTEKFFFWDTDSSYPLGEMLVYREVDGNYYCNVLGDVYGRPTEISVLNIRELE